MRLSFLVAGMQKAGTTALYRLLRQHPQIYLPTQPEVHFFDDETVDWCNPDYDQFYHCHYAKAAPSQLCGDRTPIYTYWPPALNRIRAYHPGIRIIVSLRHPRDRAYSHWRMETVRGVESMPFSKAIREGRKRIAEAGDLPGVHRAFSYVERGFYGAQLDRLYALFPSRNIRLVTQEDLRARPEAVLDRICDFLGVRRFSPYPEAAMIFSHENAGLPPPSQEADERHQEGPRRARGHCSGAGGRRRRGAGRGAAFHQLPDHPHP